MPSLKHHLKQQHPELGSREIKRLLEQGACMVNGKIERFATREIDPKQDQIEFKVLKTTAKEELKIKDEHIAWEDEHLLIYNKEAGHPALRTENGKDTNLHEELRKSLFYKYATKNNLTIPEYTNFRAELESKLSPGDKTPSFNKLYQDEINKLAKQHLYLEPAHRLDKDTSGLMIFAKSPEANKKLEEMFRNKNIYKEYEALVDKPVNLKQTFTKFDRLCSLTNINGIPNLKLKTKLDLDKKGKGYQQWKVSDNGKDSVTNMQLIKIYKDYTHLRLIPETGRTHQLRVHLAYLGHPILGDTIYAKNFSCHQRPTRHLLHASKLKFEHPITGESIKLFAELAQDFRGLI